MTTLYKSVLNCKVYTHVVKMSTMNTSGKNVNIMHKWLKCYRCKDYA